jgi:hypothetical protein
VRSGAVGAVALEGPRTTGAALGAERTSAEAVAVALSDGLVAGLSDGLVAELEVSIAGVLDVDVDAGVAAALVRLASGLVAAFDTEPRRKRTPAAPSAITPATATPIHIAVQMLARVSGGAPASIAGLAAPVIGAGVCEKPATSSSFTVPRSALR